MSTTYKGFSVILRKDISEERMQAIQTAFRLLDGVVDVVPVATDINNDYFIESRVRMKIWEDIRDVMFPERKGKT